MCICSLNVHILFGNTINLVKDVTTICHQVRCMYWRRFSFFQRVVARLNWYEMVLADLWCTFIRVKSTNMYFRFCHLGCNGIFADDGLCFINIEPCRLYVYVYQGCPPNPAKIYKTWIFVVLPRQDRQENIFGIYLPHLRLHNNVMNFNLMSHETGFFHTLSYQFWMSYCGLREVDRV